MHYNYLSFDSDKPLINTAQTYSYIKRLAPKVNVDCVIDPAMKYLANGGREWSTPQADNAAWYSPNQPGSASFLGLIPNEVRGLYDSTQSAVYAELKNEGAVHQARHFGVREIRVKATLFALSELGLYVGLEWLKDSLSGGFCGDVKDKNCGGEDLIFLTSALQATDENTAAASYLNRAMMAKDVRTLSGVKVTAEPNFDHIATVEVEFILVAANPFLYRLEPQWTMRASDATSATASELKCDPVADAYDELITDPSGGSVVRPPRPPLINPMPMPSTWNRRHLYSPSASSGEFGQMVARVTVDTAVTQRMLRVRFYRQDHSGCDYDGEFLITYVPAGHILVIDGLDKTITMLKPSGRRVSAANLVLGSDGRPAIWPVVDCKTQYRIQIDAPDSLANTSVKVEGYIRR